MARLSNTRADGFQFSQATINAAWMEATPESGYDSFRRDCRGATIHRED
jgi:hypothetical protein